MTTYISPVITDAGIKAIFSATRKGLEGDISHIALGDGGGSGYTPNANANALRNERFRVAVGGGERTGPCALGKLLIASP
jgi:phage-related tail fiber protein